MAIFYQKQHWEGSCDRILIADTEGRGSVQVDIPLTDKARERYKADALLWGLWVDEGHRQNGEGDGLVLTAEQEAKASGCKSIAIEWSLQESPYWVRDWYVRLGYEEKEFGNGSSLMVKELP